MENCPLEMFKPQKVNDLNKSDIKISIDKDSCIEIMHDIISLIHRYEREGFNTSSEFKLLKYLRGCLKKQAGITYNVKKDFIGDYVLRRKVTK